MTKAELRMDVLGLRSGIDSNDRGLWDQLIFERAHKFRPFQMAKRVHIYRSVRDEVETSPFIEYAWGTGKDVYVPVTSLSMSAMHHCKITWRTTWREGTFGIPEPFPESPDDVVTSDAFFDEDSAVIVPLVAFDRQCHRLGYGKGYYDRFLRNAAASTIGLAYEVQRVLSVEPEAHDVALSCVATQERWYVPTSKIT